MGSVVRLNRSENVDLMIINRGSSVLQDGKEVYFDYGQFESHRDWLLQRKLTFSIKKTL